MLATTRKMTKNIQTTVQWVTDDEEGCSDSNNESNDMNECDLQHSSFRGTDKNNNSNKRSTDNRRTVRFNDDVQIVAYVSSRKDLSLEEFHATWLDAEDYEITRQEIEMIESLLRCETNRHHLVYDEDEFLCSRGLLGDTDSLLHRAECNEFIQKLILNQIRFLKQQGVVASATLEETVAKLYSDCSKSAVQQAQQLALQDAADAQKYYNSFLGIES